MENDLQSRSERLGSSSDSSLLRRRRSVDPKTQSFAFFHLFFTGQDVLSRRCVAVRSEPLPSEAPEAPSLQASVEARPEHNEPRGRWSDMEDRSPQVRVMRLASCELRWKSRPANVSVLCDACIA